MIRYLLLFLLYIPLLFSAPTVVIDENDYSIDNFEVLYLKDSNTSLTIEEVSQKKFSLKTKNNFSLGYTKGDAWFKFSIENISSKNDFTLY